MIPVDRAVSVTGMKIGFCLYGDFQPAFREKKMAINGKTLKEKKKRTTEPGFPLSAPLLLKIVLHSVSPSFYSY